MSPDIGRNSLFLFHKLGLVLLLPVDLRQNRQLQLLIYACRGDDYAEKFQ